MHVAAGGQGPALGERDRDLSAGTSGVCRGEDEEEQKRKQEAVARSRGWKKGGRRGRQVHNHLMV